jgi:hypothetical protein
VLRAVVSTALLHVSDWYPTIVQGIAALPLSPAADGTPPLDGIDAWPVITGASAEGRRTEVLLNLIATAPTGGAGAGTRVPGQGAIRVGKWKLMHGHTCQWGIYGCSSCTARDGEPAAVRLGTPHCNTALK